MAVGLPPGAGPPCALWEKGFIMAAVPHYVLGLSPPCVRNHPSHPKFLSDSSDSRIHWDRELCCTAWPADRHYWFHWGLCWKCRLWPTQPQRVRICLLGGCPGRPVTSEKCWSGQPWGARPFLPSLFLLIARKSPVTKAPETANFAPKAPPTQYPQCLRMHCHSC